MRRKWSILLVEMCAVAFWKSCTFIMTYEYCLILCKIESGQCSVLAVVTMLPNLQKLCFSLHSRVEMLYWRAQRGLQSLLQWLIPKSPLPLEQQRSNDVKLLLNYRWKVPKSYVFGFVSVLLFAHKGLSSQVLALQEDQNGQLHLTALFGNSSNMSNRSRQLPEQISHPSLSSTMGKFNLGALKSESKKDKQWFLSQGTWWRGIYFLVYFWRYRL